MYVRDIRDGLNYIVYVMLFMSEMSKIYKHVFAHIFLNICCIIGMVSNETNEDVRMYT